MKKYSSTFQWRMAVFHLYGYTMYKDTRSCSSYVDHNIQSERHWPSAGHVTRVRVTKSSARPPENPPKKSRSTSNVTYWRNDVQTWCLQSSKETHFLWVGEKKKMPIFYIHCPDTNRSLNVIRSSSACICLAQNLNILHSSESPIFTDVHPTGASSWIVHNVLYMYRYILYTKIKHNRPQGKYSVYTLPVKSLDLNF